MYREFDLMKILLRIKFYLILFVLIFLLISALAISSYFRWNMEINFLGGNLAYQLFVIENKNYNYTLQHENAHVFGLLLYNKYGIQGINYCDDSFNYGCYHILTATAINKEGLATIKEILKMCQKLPNSIRSKSCQHGIGHGILAHFGYSLNNLSQSLKECDLIEQKYSETCSSGVFMEYNFQSMHTNSQQVRKLDPAKPHFPCDSINPESRPGCYFQQTQWWLTSLSGTNVEKVQQIETFCSQLSSLEVISCYKGLTLHLPSFTGWNFEETQKLCGYLSTEHGSECLASTTNIFNSRE